MASRNATVPDLTVVQGLTSILTPVPQVSNPPPFGVEFLMVTPEEAAVWWETMMADEEFRNRPLNTTDARHYKDLIDSDRFVHFLPNGIICRDPLGIFINGKTRMAGLKEAKKPAGFVIFTNVPRWMWMYMDILKPKTARQVLFGNHKMDKPQAITALRFVIKYEEFLNGIRDAEGWRHWSTGRDEFADLDHIHDLRREMMDDYGNAMAIRKGGCHLLAAPLMLFRYYQYYAWPDGRGILHDFCEALRLGTDPRRWMSAQSLRNWSTQGYFPTQGKKEAHLILLFQHFESYAKKAWELEQRSKRRLDLDGVDKNFPQIREAVVAYGSPMRKPFHPDGELVALANLQRSIPPLNTPRFAVNGSVPGARKPEIPAATFASPG